MADGSNVSNPQADPGSLAILCYPDPSLRRPAKPIEVIDDEVRRVAHRMLELMREAEGVGLAAPQVGLPWRMFVAHDLQPVQDDDSDSGHNSGNRPGQAPDQDAGPTPGLGQPCRVWINPQLEVFDPATDSDEEGCLSLPDILVHVTRPVQIRIRGLDLDGNLVEAQTDTHLARVWQHEIDHLNGVLIIDKMSSMDRIRNRRAIRDLEQR
jgi:peptide deformylase